MSLEGTLETIALPDVLALLSVTYKTGELRIEAGGGVGSVWFDEGQFAGFDVGGHQTAVDALFALLRLREGKFKFHTGTPPLNAIEPHDVSPMLEEAENRLMQWPAIVAVVPSLYSELHLQESVDGTVMLRPDQWQLVVTVGGGRSVADVLNVRGLGEFDGCKAVKDLVDLRLVRVTAGEAPPEAEMALNAAVPTADLSAAVHDAALEAVGRLEEQPLALGGVDEFDEFGSLGEPIQYVAPDEHLDALPPFDPAQHFEPVQHFEPLQSFEPLPPFEPAQHFEPAPHFEPVQHFEYAEPVEPVDVGAMAEVDDLSQVWNDETGEVETRSSAGTASAVDAVDAEEAPAAAVSDPVNRGLLLKFLGSARN